MLTFFSSNFAVSTAIGTLGVFAWILKTWADPNDDRITTTLYRAFYLHSTSLTIGFLSYVVSCKGIEVAKPEAFNWYVAATTGFLIQSVTETLFRPKDRTSPGGVPSDPPPSAPKRD